MLTPDAHLTVDGLSKTFTLHILNDKRVVALRDVSFSVPPGAFLGIVGPSGGGKSSLLKCLFRTYLPTAGAVWYRTADGRSVDLATAPDEEIIALRGGEIGYVSQFLRPTPRVTAVDLVAQPLVRRGVGRDEARGRAAELLRRLALPPDLFDGYPVLFSGGEQQRVNIARALIALPRLLLLDEPTSALDTANQETVIDLLREAHAAGTTILGIFHDLTVLRRLADGYLLLRGGRLAGAGQAATVSPEALLAAPAR
jgi:alpha-D-ribose 1-methylphosphonate 5-triphosphate synthase subunit PhnL